ncbi:MAG: response regulator [bacterium]|nr:response regulator [bacterium]
MKQFKILLVEDEEMLQAMYSQKFFRSGCKVISAYNGEEGLELANTESPDLILLDVLMPKMNGFSALRELKANKATKDIPVIMLTNLQQGSEAQMGLDLGAEEYLVKTSYTPKQIVTKCMELLQQFQSIPSKVLLKQGT